MSRVRHARRPRPDRSTLEGYASWARGALAALPAQLISECRHEAGLAPLKADPELLPAAQAHVMAGWMQSPEHRRDILDPAYTHLAIAAAARGEAVVVVQPFEARQALLAEPLPLHVGQGETLALAFEQREGLAVPAQYAYARPDQPAQELVTLDLSIDEVPVEPGAYVLKFLFASGQAGRFEVVGGPAILVQ